MSILLRVYRLPMTVFTIQQDLRAVHQVLSDPLDLSAHITDYAVGFHIAFHTLPFYKRGGTTRRLFPLNHPQ